MLARAPIGSSYPPLPADLLFKKEKKKRKKKKTFFNGGGSLSLRIWGIRCVASVLEKAWRMWVWIPIPPISNFNPALLVLFFFFIIIITIIIFFFFADRQDFLSLS